MHGDMMVNYSFDWTDYIWPSIRSTTAKLTNARRLCLLVFVITANYYCNFEIYLFHDLFTFIYFMFHI
jgi:hypothetical protein